jgi:hypothetical protein
LAVGFAKIVEVRTEVCGVGNDREIFGIRSKSEIRSHDRFQMVPTGVLWLNGLLNNSAFKF